MNAEHLLLVFSRTEASLEFLRSVSSERRAGGDSVQSSSESCTDRIPYSAPYGGAQLNNAVMKLPVLASDQGGGV